MADSAQARERATAQVAPGIAPVTDDELKAVALRLPALFHAAKTNGGPAPEEIRQLMGGVALGPRHFGALRQVMAHGPMTVSALGGQLGVALPTASLMVAELSRAGLLERVEDDEDRRRTIVRVAPAKAAAIEAFMGRRLDPLRRALGQLTPAERAAFAHGLEALAGELRAAGMPPTYCAPSGEVPAG